MTIEEFTNHLDSVGMKYLWTNLPNGNIYIKFPQSNRIVGFTVGKDKIAQYENLEDIWYNLFYLAQESGSEFEKNRMKATLGLW